MSNDFSVEVVQMTPEWATELLRSNTNNRGLSKTRAKSFAKQIEKGKWRKTGQGISVASNGRLLYGQTRSKNHAQDKVLGGLPAKELQGN
jgi:hypothetical protein